MYKLFLALLLCGCSGANMPDLIQVNQPIIVYAQNQSSWPREEFLSYIQAQNTQLQRDFGPRWGIQAQVVEGRGDYQLTILPDFSSLNVPIDWKASQGLHVGHNAYANLITSQTPAVSCSHEVLEMLINPDNNNGKEVCDPVAPFGYNVNGLQSPKHVADFVFPNYFQQGSTGPWDQLGKIKSQGGTY